MSEREATQLLERLADRLPPTFPPTAALIRGGRARRRRRRAVRCAGGLAVAGVVGLTTVVWGPDPAPEVHPAPPAAPAPAPGTHWEGAGGALVAVPDHGTVSVRTRAFGAADQTAWSLPATLTDAKPVDTLTRGPNCQGQGDLTTCRSRMAIPSLQVLVVVDASGARARAIIDEVLGSVTYVSPSVQPDAP